MRVGIIRERAEHERRVPLIPDSVKRLRQKQIDVSVERGAGAGSLIPDEEFAAAGAELVDERAAVLLRSDVLLRLHIPSVEEVGELRAGSALVSPIFPRVHPDLVAALSARRIDTVAVDCIPRTTVAQMMDVLSSQATVAGYCAVLMAAGGAAALLPDAHDRGGHDRAGAGPRARRGRRRACRPSAPRGGWARSSRPSTCARWSRSRSRAWARSSSRSSGEDAQTAGGYAKEMSRRVQEEAGGGARASTLPSADVVHHHRAHPRPARADPDHRGDGEDDEARIGHRRSRGRAAGQLRADRAGERRGEGRRHHHRRARPAEPPGASTRARCTRATWRSCSST